MGRGSRASPWSLVVSKRRRITPDTSSAHCGAASTEVAGSIYSDSFGRRGSKKQTPDDSSHVFLLPLGNPNPSCSRCLVLYDALLPAVSHRKPQVGRGVLLLPLLLRAVHHSLRRRAAASPTCSSAPSRVNSLVNTVGVWLAGAGGRRAEVVVDRLRVRQV